MDVIWVMMSTRNCSLTRSLHHNAFQFNFIAVLRNGQAAFSRPPDPGTVSGKLELPAACEDSYRHPRGMRSARIQ